jgi:hypothetical protein
MSDPRSLQATIIKVIVHGDGSPQGARPNDSARGQSRRQLRRGRVRRQGDRRTVRIPMVQGRAGFPVTFLPEIPHIGTKRV